MAYFTALKTTVASTIAITALALAGCTTTGNMERGAATGAGLGGLLGAVIGNNAGSGDASTGAAIGAVIGGAGGAYSGYIQDQNSGRWVQPIGQPTLYWDADYRRYYSVDHRTGCTYWRNGQRRS